MGIKALESYGVHMDHYHRRFGEFYGYNGSLTHASPESPVPHDAAPMITIAVSVFRTPGCVIMCCTNLLMIVLKVLVIYASCDVL